MIDRVQDACRFVLYSQSGIRDWPLQVYAAALIFSPERSITRLQYQSEEPRWIINKPNVEYHWSPCLQTLEHGGELVSLCFSPDSQLIASSSRNGTVKTWDSSSGQCLTNFYGNASWIFPISFFSNSKLLAFTLSGKVWDITDGLCVANLDICADELSRAKFFQRPHAIATGSKDGMINFWNSSNGECSRQLEGHSDSITHFAFSQDLQCLASASRDGTIKIWNTNNGNCLRTINAHEEMVISMDFSPDSRFLASGSMDNTIRLWETRNWNCFMSLHGHTSWIKSLKFSHDSKILASGSDDNGIKLWDTDSGNCLQTLHGHQGPIECVFFSHNSQLLASASSDGTVRIWDAKSRQQPRQFDSHGGRSRLHLSHDTSLLASVAEVEDEGPWGIKIWDVRNGKCIQSLEGSQGRTHHLMFSNDLKLFAESSGDRTVRVWDIRSAKLMQTFTGSHDVKEFFLDNPHSKLFDGTICSSSFSSYGPNGRTHNAILHPGAYGISRDGRCITRNSECLLWLPPEYRGSSVQTESTLCTSCSSGRVLLFTFDSVMLSDTLPAVQPVMMAEY